MTVDPRPPRVRIIHETNPRKYFPALYELAIRDAVEIVGEHRPSVIREWLRSWFKGRTPFRERTVNALGDLRLLAQIRSLAGETIVLAFAPWDWRLLKFRSLTKRNRVIYHTSWMRWRRGEVPRSYGPFDRFLMRQWRAFIRDPHVTVVAVTSTVQRELCDVMSVDATVIPHAVPAAFYEVRRRSRSAPGLRLISVGELSRNKGSFALIELMQRVTGNVTLTVVGDGPLRETWAKAAEADPRINLRGPIWDREELASLLAGHDVLLLPSQRSSRWEELFGIVLIEAMATGLGIIASDHIGPRTVMSGRDLGNLFAESDIDGMSALIADLARDAEMREAFIQKHRGLADPYRADAVGRQWASLLGVSDGRVE